MRGGEGWSRMEGDGEVVWSERMKCAEYPVFGIPHNTLKKGVF